MTRRVTEGCERSLKSCHGRNTGKKAMIRATIVLILILMVIFVIATNVWDWDN